MQKNTEFVDYYELLQISPHAEMDTIKRVFKLLAVRVHPDNPVTGDADAFRRLKEAYEVLSDPRRRQVYDLALEEHAEEPLPVFEMSEFSAGVDGEMNRRVGILCLLYNSRRANEDKPGLSIMEMENLMGIPREHLAFAVWYLKNKQYVTSGESSDIVITSEGIDYLESNLPTSRVAYKLLKAAEKGTTRTDRTDEAAPNQASGERRQGPRVVQ